MTLIVFVCLCLPRDGLDLTVQSVNQGCLLTAVLKKAPSFTALFSVFYLHTMYLGLKSCVWFGIMAAALCPGSSPFPVHKDLFLSQHPPSVFLWHLQIVYYSFLSTAPSLLSDFFFFFLQSRHIDCHGYLLQCDCRVICCGSVIAWGPVFIQCILYVKCYALLSVSAASFPQALGGGIVWRAWRVKAQRHCKKTAE